MSHKSVESTQNEDINTSKDLLLLSQQYRNTNFKALIVASNSLNSSYLDYAENIFSFCTKITSVEFDTYFNLEKANSQASKRNIPIEEFQLLKSYICHDHFYSYTMQEYQKAKEEDGSDLDMDTQKAINQRIRRLLLKMKDFKKHLAQSIFINNTSSESNSQNLNPAKQIVNREMEEFDLLYLYVQSIIMLKAVNMACLFECVQNQNGASHVQRIRSFKVNAHKHAQQINTITEKNTRLDILQALNSLFVQLEKVCPNIKEVQALKNHLLHLSVSTTTSGNNSEIMVKKLYENAPLQKQEKFRLSKFQFVQSTKRFLKDIKKAFLAHPGRFAVALGTSTAMVLATIYANVFFSYENSFGKFAAHFAYNYKYQILLTKLLLFGTDKVLAVSPQTRILFDVCNTIASIFNIPYINAMALIFIVYRLVDNLIRLLATPKKGKKNPTIPVEFILNTNAIPLIVGIISCGLTLFYFEGFLTTYFSVTKNGLFSEEFEKISSYCKAVMCYLAKSFFELIPKVFLQGFYKFENMKTLIEGFQASQLFSDTAITDAAGKSYQVEFNGFLSQIILNTVTSSTSIVELGFSALKCLYQYQVGKLVIGGVTSGVSYAGYSAAKTLLGSKKRRQPEKSLQSSSASASDAAAVRRLKKDFSKLTKSFDEDKLMKMPLKDVITDLVQTSENIFSFVKNYKKLHLQETTVTTAEPFTKRRRSERLGIPRIGAAFTRNDDTLFIKNRKIHNLYRLFVNNNLSLEFKHGPVPWEELSKLNLNSIQYH